jgi:hypothetical protein
MMKYFLTLMLAGSAAAGCTDGGGGGCSPPVGEKWDRWDMAGSTYTYCYQGCAVDWLYDNKDNKTLNLGECVPPVALHTVASDAPSKIHTLEGG